MASKVAIRTEKEDAWKLCVEGAGAIWVPDPASGTKVPPEGYFTLTDLEDTNVIDIMGLFSDANQACTVTVYGWPKTGWGVPINGASGLVIQGTSILHSDENGQYISTPVRVDVGAFTRIFIAVTVAPLAGTVDFYRLEF